jgi:hypothetical protein
VTITTVKHCAHCALFYFHSFIHSYFYPVLKCGIVFWGTAKNYKKVFILQKRAMIILAKVSGTTSCKHLFRALKIITLPFMYIYEILLQFRMSVNNYKTNSKIHLHDTRQKWDLFITGHNTKLFEQSTTYSSIHIYNRLAKEIKNTETLREFKKKLTDSLIEECFYSVEEFLNY